MEKNRKNQIIARTTILIAAFILIAFPAAAEPDPGSEPTPNLATPTIAGEMITPAVIVAARSQLEKAENAVMEVVRESSEALLPPKTYQNLTAPIFQTITPLRIIVSAAIFALVVALRFVLNGLFNRRLARGDPASPRSPLNLFLTALQRPLILALWSYGFYAGTAPLLVPLSKADGESSWLVMAGTIADVIGLWAFIGFVFRLINLIYARIAQWAATSENRFERILIPLAARYLRVLIPAMAVLFTIQLVDVADRFDAPARTAASLLIIAVIIWMLIEVVSAVESLILAGYRMDEADNLEARRIFTQVHMLKKVTVAGLILLGGASMLMVFPSVRQFGTSILASAGIAGIILGIAAQRSLANFIAGFQIAITQPIRIEDAVIVEGEWGWVEEVTLTYVVVRIWDWRRLVLPITYFVEKPFQNWTRNSGNILGSVFLYVDYSIPLEALRTRLDEILEETDLWDRNAKVLQVTDSRHHDIEIRILCSGKDSPTTWDLRCHVREKMIEFICENYPESLPRIRTELNANGRDPGDRQTSALA